MIGVVAAEVYLRLIGARTFTRTSPGEYRTEREGARWAQPDPYLGWTGVRGGTDTNAQGFRDDKSFSDVALDGSVERVMILGDSFMYGAGSREESVPRLLNERLGGTHQVFNVAVPGWGIDQMYLAYRRYKDVMKPHVIILTFIDDDVSRVLQAYRRDEGLTKPSFTLDDGELRPRTAQDATSAVLNGMMKRSCLLSRIMHETYLALEARPMVLAMFSQIARESHEEGRRFVVLRIPLEEHASLSGRLEWYLRGWRTAITDIGAVYLDPLGEMRGVEGWPSELYVKNGHLSAPGSRVLASFIYDHVFRDARSTS